MVIKMPRLHQIIYVWFSVLCTRWSVSNGQTVTVQMQPTTSAEQGTSASFMCSYSINDASYSANYIQWQKDGTRIAWVFSGQAPNYPGGAMKYAMSTDSIDSSSVLTISSVQFPSDEGRYVCRVQFLSSSSGSTSISNETSTMLTVIVVPKRITLSDSAGSDYPTGSTAYLVEGVARQFTCEVPDINPGASFTWSLDGGVITVGNTVDVIGTNNLTTSTSIGTLSPIWSHHEKMLQCQASNKDGHAGKSISVTLDIKVPPKTSSMYQYNSDDTFTPGGSVRVDQDASHTFTCQTLSRPAATIQWDVGSPSYQDSTIGPTNPGPGDGLVNTTRTWTFTPSRTNHRQDVRCTANTTESQQPYPAVTVTLNITGPPDMPVISGNAGSTSMTENDPIVLTCTADMGYPEDWKLDWSNGGSPAPPTTWTASGDRFSFNSTLNYTARREDNGNTITCTANRDSWTSGPQGSLGPIDVKFCARSLSVTQTPPQATAGSSVSLRCATSESSNPATSLIWSKDNVDLVPTDQSNTTGDYGGRLTSVTYTITLDKTDNGDMYRCCATNPAISSCATPLCEMHTLNVRYPPDFILLTLTPQTPVTEGGNVTLACTVDANPPTVDITWKKNDQVDVLKTTGGVNSTLTLSNIRRQDAGYYTCTANNGVPTDDNSADVVSSPITVIVHYEVNITNKAMNEVGVKNGDTAVLTCIAVGNPKPVMEWYGPNTTGLISDMDEGKFLISNKTSGGDRVFQFEVTSNLTIKTVDSLVDYGVYTCISSNGIGRGDSLNITLNGTRRPDKPTRVEITARTAENLTVTWTPGYDGGETQSFRVSYIKTSDSTEVFTEETDGKTTSTATGLDDYTEYEIRVYAKNAIGESSGHGSTMGFTLPKTPGTDSGITVEFNEKDGTVAVGGLKGNGCIQLEVQYQVNGTWQECGDCIESDQTVTLSEWCASSQRRRRRAVADIEAVRARLCIGGLCSEPADAKKEVIVTTPTAAPPGLDVGLIVGATVGGVILVTIIVVLVVYLVRTSPQRKNGKEDSFSRANDIEDVELHVQEPNHDVQPEENNGITNEALQNNDTYAQVNKTKLPPKPQSARSAPTNLPDVTYAEVNRDKKPKPPPDDYAAKKKPKKYVPPSSRAAEESAYEEVQISDKDKAKIPPAAASADTYASVGGQQDTSGRVVTEDGLIYAEVGHMKQHPVDQPPIQTEESTEYASLDFARMKPEDK